MGIAEELHVLLCAVWTGEVCIMGYALLMRGMAFWRKKKCQDSIEVLLYFTTCGFYIFYNMMNTCDGVIRWYFFMGIVVGIISGHIILCALKKIWENLEKKT